jgi:HK97 family phage major capsid protein
VTIEEMIRATEREIDAATRERSRYIAEVEVILGRASDDRRSNLTQAETRRVEELFQLRDAKREDIAKLKAKLATARQAATEEDEYVASMATRQRGASLPSRDEPRAGEFVRQSDGRKAALEHGQRWADHPVVAEYAGRRAQVEDAVVGQHGSLAAHLRAMPPREVPSLQQERVMTTTTGSAVVPTVWATDIIDRARNLAAVTRAGAAIVPMDALIVQIGRLTADPTAAFRNEGSTVTASDPTFDNVTLTAKTMSALVVGSMEWFQDSPNVDEVGARGDCEGNCAAIGLGRALRRGDDGRGAGRGWQQLAADRQPPDPAEPSGHPRQPARQRGLVRARRCHERDRPDGRNVLR